MSRLFLSDDYDRDLNELRKKEKEIQKQLYQIRRRRYGCEVCTVPDGPFGCRNTQNIYTDKVMDKVYESMKMLKKRCN